jgi:hypothetical protein
MPTFYVSKTATNGYAIGDDSNNGTSKSTPKLTIAGAQTAASTGDTVIINDGTYGETLTLTKGITYTPVTDYGVTITHPSANAGNPVITTSSAAGVTFTFGKLIVDAYSVNGQAAIASASGANAVHSIVMNGTKLIAGNTYAFRDRIVTGSSTLTGCIIESNSNTVGQVINCVLTRITGALTITNSTFTLNFSSASANNKGLWFVGASAVGDGATPSFTFTGNTVLQTNANTSAPSNYFGLHIQNATTFTFENNLVDIDHSGTGNVMPVEISAYQSLPTYEGRAMSGTCHDNRIINRGTAGVGILIGNDGFNGETFNKIAAMDVYNNYVECTSRATTTHGILYGQADDGRIYGNYVKNVPLAIIFKGQSGGIMSGNIVENTIATGGAYGSLRIKGSQNTVVANNTVVNAVSPTYVGGLGDMYQEDDIYGISSITSVSTTATVTTSASHNLFTGNSITISGAVQTEYNGTYTITVTGANTFTYTFAGSATSPATGTKVYVPEDRFGNATGIVWANNIIQNAGATAKPFTSSNASQTATFFNNNYYMPSASSITYTYNGTNRTTFALWQSNVEATATNVDPSFTVGYVLGAGSSLIGTGYTSVPATALDYSGRALNATPTVGARETFGYLSSQGKRSIQDSLNRIAGTTGLRNAEALRVINGRETSSDTEQDGWNFWAATKGLRIQDAANTKANTTGLRVQDCVNLL